MYWGKACITFHHVDRTVGNDNNRSPAVRLRRTFQFPAWCFDNRKKKSGCNFEVLFVFHLLPSTQSQLAKERDIINPYIYCHFKITIQFIWCMECLSAGTLPSARTSHLYFLLQLRSGKYISIGGSNTKVGAKLK